MNDNDGPAVTDCGLDRLRVLVVEDNAEARVMVKAMLGFIGVRHILEAGDGRRALAMLDGKEPEIDVVLCDWTMPEIDGLTLMRHWRDIRPDTPFLMVTGRIDDLSAMEAKRYGVDAYIRKPFAPEQLETKLRAIAKQLNV